MKNLFYFGWLILMAAPSMGQDTLSGRYPVAETGCSLFFPGDPGAFEVSTSDDGLPVYTAEVRNEDVSYGVILVKLGEDFKGAPDSTMEGLLVSYFTFLQSTLGFDYAVGVTKGQKLPSYEAALGISDYWSHEDGTSISLQGWTTDQFLVVLYVTAKKMPKPGVCQVFFEGFRFPD